MTFWQHLFLWVGACMALGFVSAMVCGLIVYSDRRSGEEDET